MNLIIRRAEHLKMKCPETLSETVLEFCKLINDETPFYLTPNPYPWCLPNECFSNAYHFNTNFGGQFIVGWAIWMNKLLIEAEFHCIVVNPDGTYNDITPNTSNQVLFLPDYDIEFTGVSVDNIRKALIDHPLIHTFIEKHEEKAKILFPTGRIDSTNSKKIQKLDKEIEAIYLSILQAPGLL